MDEARPDILIVGGGVGGVAAAIAACSLGARVLMTEEHSWLGGQFTSQAVPADEHPWIETTGSTASYRRLRKELREHYFRFYPLAASRSDKFNPGNGWVGPLCAEPRAALAVIEGMLAPWRASGRLIVRTHTVPIAVAISNDHIVEVRFRTDDGGFLDVRPKLVLEATETGDLLDLANVEHRTGAESSSATGEPSGAEVYQPFNMQAVTHCFAIDHVDGDHTIDKPSDYEEWRMATLPGWHNPQLDWTYPNPRSGAPITGRFEPNSSSNATDMETALRAPELWTYRRVLDRRNYQPGFLASDVTIVNWPMNDYVGGTVFGTDEGAEHRARAKALGRSFLYWMQTDAPRPDGGTGYPGLRLRPDVVGTEDGFAEALYIREGRRIEALVTPKEQDLSVAVRGDRGGTTYRDTVGTGAYRMDLHPTTGGDGYLDLAAHPFEIPLGALLPVRVRNLVAAGKTIGTTHITNGCYRVHPAEWSIGEAAGTLASYCLNTNSEPHAVFDADSLLADFQGLLSARGVDLRWSNSERLPI